MKGVNCPLCGSENAVPAPTVLSAPVVQCRQCGLLHRRSPSRAEPSDAGQAEDAASRRLEERVGQRRSWHFRRFLRSAGRPGKLLDVGCGYGFFLKLAQEAGWDSIGIDVDPRAVAYAADRLGVNAYRGDLRVCRFSDGSFDLVTLWNVLDHVPDPLDLLREVHRVLRHGGQVFIRTPNAPWQLLSFRAASLLKYLGWGAVLEAHPRATFVFHLTSFSRSTLRLLIERAGLVPVRIRNSPPVKGDPYLGVGWRGELLINLAKATAHGFAQGLSLLSGGWWLLGSSLEAYARRTDEIASAESSDVAGRAESSGRKERRLLKSHGSHEVFDDYWDRIEQRYRKQYSEGNVLAYGKYVVYLNNRLLETRFPRGQGIRSLECGAGRGDTSLYFAKRGYTTILLDLSVKALAIATRNFQEEGVEAHCIRADLFQTGFKDNMFDVVMSYGLLEHMEDVALPVREMVRVLRPGGVFCSSVAITNRLTVQTPVDYCYHIPGTLLKNFLQGKPKRALNMAKSYLDHEYFENTCSQADYLNVLKECGLTDVEVHGANFFPYIRLPHLLEKGYVLILRKIIRFRRLLGVEEPFLTRTNLGKIWLLFGRKPQVS